MNEESIFAEACAKKTPKERSAYLDGACGRDQELRNRIEQLLAAHSHPDKCLEAPQRRVTLKIIKPGKESEGAIARFGAQRQALATMEHTHIGRR